MQTWPLTLSPREEALVEQLKQTGALKPVDTDRLDPAKGIVLVTCSDGDCFPDVFRFHHMKLGTSRVHPVANPGGALLLSEDAPFNDELPSDLVVLRGIRIGIHELGIPQTGLYVCAPCRAARAAGLSLHRVLQHFAVGERRVRKEFLSADVASFVHAHYPDGRQLSYSFDRQAWEA